MGKIVITGTGRCGTSFLMHLFTALGFNTGYTIDECEQHLAQSGCNGGIEHSIGTKRFEKAYIVKNPEWFYKPELLDFDIDYIIFPFRELNHVAKSRERNIGYGGFLKGVNNIESQMKMDSKAVTNFMNYIINKRITIIILDFPKIIKDVDYLFDKLIFLHLLFGGDEFKEKFIQIAKPEKVHI